MSGSSGHSFYGGHRCAPYTVQLTGHGDFNVIVTINAMPGPMIGGGVVPMTPAPMDPAPMTPSGFRKGDGKRGGKDAGKSGGSDGFEVIESGTPGYIPPTPGYIPPTPGPFARKGGESGGKDGCKDGGKDGGRSSSESGKGGCRYGPPVGVTLAESVELPDESRPM